MSSAKIFVTQEDINAFKLAKEENQFVNIVSTNMINSALKKAGFWEDWNILVLRDRLIIQKPERDNIYYWFSHPVYFCSTLIEYLRIHDDLKFDKISPFELELELEKVDFEPVFEPFIFQKRGLLKVV